MFVIEYIFPTAKDGDHTQLLATHRNCANVLISAVMTKDVCTSFDSETNRTRQSIICVQETAQLFAKQFAKDQIRLKDSYGKNDREN